MRCAWLLVLVPGLALAVPPTLSHSGRLLDPAGQPVNGEGPAQFTLYDAADSSGEVLWSETDDVVFADGYFSTVLGDDIPFADTVFDGSTRWLGITLDGVELSPRTPIHAVPYAVRSADSDALDGLTRTEVESSLGSVADDLDALSTATLDASRLTEGTVAFDRLPTGTGASEVAVGNHNTRVFVHRYQTETGADYSSSWASPGYGDFSYTKRSPTSHLKITWTASLRTIDPDNNGGVCMWRYLINGSSCGPAPMTLFQHDTGSSPSADKHMPHSTTVVCEGLPAGELAFTQQARRRDDREDCHFGYSGASYGGPFFTTLVIEEVEY